MITALSTPASSSVLLDANNTIIKIQSTNGAGYYFRALIYIDGVLFDQQSWSRIDAFTAITDLKKLYNAYFDVQFNPVFIPGLSVVTNTKKQVSIVINEYSIAGGAVVSSLTLPSFYIMYNIKPVAFDGLTRLSFLGLNPDVMVISPKGKISVPFYAKYASGNIFVTLSTPTGTVLNAIQANQDGVYLYNFDLSTISLAYAVTHLLVKINIGAGNLQVTKTVTYRLNQLPDFPLREIAFQNNFGFYIYAYLDGEMQVQDAFDISTYETKNGDSKASQIDETASYTINSGSFNSREKVILNMIANSLDVHFNNAGTWLTLLPQTKKVISFKDRQHIYGADLLFTLKKDPDVANVRFIQVLPNVADIVITGQSVSGQNITLTVTFNNGFTATKLLVQVRTANSSTWLSTPVAGVSPVTLKVSAGSYVLRIADFNNTSNVSNQINVTTV